MDLEKLACMTLVKAARNLQGGLYAANPCETTDEDSAGIFERSYKLKKELSK